MTQVELALMVLFVGMVVVVYVVAAWDRRIARRHALEQGWRAGVLSGWAARAKAGNSPTTVTNAFVGGVAMPDVRLWAGSGDDHITKTVYMLEPEPDDA